MLHGPAKQLLLGGRGQRGREGPGGGYGGRGGQGERCGEVRRIVQDVHLAGDAPDGPGVQNDSDGRGLLQAAWDVQGRPGHHLQSNSWHCPVPEDGV